MSLTPRPSDRPLDWPEIVFALQEQFPDVEAYLVGGVVRDVYMRRPIHDLDLVVPGDGCPLARQIANAWGGAFYPLDTTRGVGRAIIDWQGSRFTIDVAQFRAETLLQDLQDRDFTVNAIAVALHDLDHLLDPLNGITDIQQRLVRLCHPQSIANDPVRALRAIRLSLSHQMRLTPETKAAVRHDGAALRQVSSERIRDELMKLLDGRKPMSAISLLDTLELLPLIFPELPALKGVQQSPPHIYDAWRHTLSVIDYLDQVMQTTGEKRSDATAANFALGMVAYSLPHLRADLQNHLAKEWPNHRSHRALLILAALAHDVAKPLTQSIADDGRIHFYRHEDEGAKIVARWGSDLALSSDEIARLKTIVRNHMRPLLLHQSGLSRRALYRFWRDLGEAGVDVCLLTLADFLGKRGNTLQQAEWLSYVQMVGKLLEGYFQEREELVVFKPFVNGNDLIDHLKITPGPQLGHLIAALHEAQALGEVQSATDSFEWAARWLTEHDPAKNQASLPSSSSGDGTSSSDTNS